MCSFITQHNASDVASFEGACNCYPHNRRPRVTTPALDFHIHHLHLQDRLRPAAAAISLHNQRISAQTVRNVSGKLICMLVILIGVWTWLQFVVITDLSGQMLTFYGIWHFEEVFSSWMNPGFHCTGQMQTTCMVSCGCQRCGSSGPWWRWSYGMGMRMLCTTDTGAFYWWRLECTEIP